MYEAGAVAVLLGGRLNRTGFVEWGRELAKARAEKSHSVVLGAKDEASGPINRFLKSVLGARDATLELQTTVKESMGGVSRSTAEAATVADRELGGMGSAAKRVGESMLGVGESAKEMSTVVKEQTTGSSEAMAKMAQSSKAEKDTVVRQNEEIASSYKAVRREAQETAGAGMVPPGGRGPHGTAAMPPGGANPEQQAKRATAAWKEGFNTLANVGKWTTAAFLGIGAVSVKWAADFERNMTLIRTQAGATDREMGQLKQGVLALAPAVGIGPTELAKGLFHIESAGFHGKRALDILKLSAEGSKVGMANLEDTTNGLVAVMRSAPKDIHSVGEAMGVMNDIVGRGNMHMEDLVKALGTGIVAAGKHAGLGLRDIGAALDVMTTRGIPAEQAATRLRTTLTLMHDPTNKAQKALQQLGMGQTQLAQDMQRHGLAYALEDLQHHLDATFPKGGHLTIDQEREALMKYGRQLEAAGVHGKTLQSDLVKFKLRMQESGGAAIKQSQIITEAFGGSRMGTTMALLMQNTDDVKKHFDELNQGGAARRFQSDWQRTQKDFSVQVSQVVAAIRELGIRIGDWLIPKIKAFVIALVDAAKWLGHHKVLAEALAVVFGTLLVAAVAAFFGRLAMGVVNGIKDIGNFAREVGKLPGRFADAARSIGKSLGIIREDAVKTKEEVQGIGVGAEAGAMGAPGGGGGPSGVEQALTGGAGVEGMITGVRGTMAPGTQENPLAVVVMASELYGLGGRGSAAEQSTASQAKAAAKAEAAGMGSVGGTLGAKERSVAAGGSPMPSWIGQSTGAATSEQRAASALEGSAQSLDKVAGSLGEAAGAEKTSAAAMDSAAGAVEGAATAMDQAATTAKESAGTKVPMAPQAPQRSTMGLPPEFRTETRAAASAEEKAASALDQSAASLDKSAAALNESAAVAKTDSAESSAATKEAAATTKEAAVATDQAAGATGKSALATDQAAASTEKAALTTDEAAASTEKAALATDGAATALEGAALKGEIPGAAGVPAGGAAGEAGGLGSKLMKGAGIAGTGLIASQILGSVIGGKAGSAVSTIGSGASIGAGIGSMAGPWGTAIGAALGGAVAAAIKFLGSKDYGKEIAGTLTKGFGGPAADDLKKQLSAALDDAHKVAEQGAKNILTTGRLELTPAQKQKIADDMYKAGNLVASQLEKGWDQYKILVEPPMFTQLKAEIRKLPPMAQSVGISSTLAFVQGLEKNHRMPAGSWEAMLRDVNRQFPGWEKQLTGFAAQGTKGFALALNFGQAQAKTKRAMDRMRGDINIIPQVMDSTAGTTDQKALAVIAALEKIPHKGSGPVSRTVRRDIRILREQVMGDFETMIPIIEGFVTSLTGAISSIGQAMGGFLGNLTSGLAGLASVAAPAIAAVTQAARSGALATPQGVRGLQAAITKFAGPVKHPGRQGGGFITGDPHGDHTLVPAAGGELMVTAHGQQMMEHTAPGLVNHVVANQRPHPQMGGNAAMPRGSATELAQVGRAGMDTGKGLNTATNSAHQLTQALMGLSSGSKKAHNDLRKNLKDATDTTDHELKKNHSSTNKSLKDIFKLHKDFGNNAAKNMYQTFVKGGQGQNEAIQPMVKDSWDSIKKTTQTYTTDVQNMMKKSNTAIVTDAHSYGGQLTGAHKNMAHTVAQADAQLATSSAQIFSKMDSASYSGVKAVFDELNKALSTLGVKQVTFSGDANPGAATTQAISGVNSLIPFAAGGVLPGSEYGRGDNMTLVDPYGNPRARMAGDEWIFNRHQAPYVDMGLRMLGFHGAEDLWSKVDTPHYYAKGGSLPGFAAGGAPGGQWFRTGATIDPTGASAQASPGNFNNGMSFAELGATPGYPNYVGGLIARMFGRAGGDGLPFGTHIDARMPGSKNSFDIIKSDIGSGQAGNLHYTVDLHQAIASALGWSPNGDIEIAPAGTDPNAKVTGSGTGAATAIWTDIKQPKWGGPGAVAKTIGDAILKKATDAANKYGQSHMPVVGPGAPGSWGGGTVPGIASKPSGYFFPFPKGMNFSWQRIDQGQDMEEQPGAPVLAIAPGVVSVASDRFGGFGPFYATQQISSGPLSGRGVYYGHTKAMRTGSVNAGDVIAVTQSAANSWTAAPAGWLELGFLPYGSMSAGNEIAPILHAIFSGSYAKGGSLKNQPQKMLGDSPKPLRNALRSIVHTGYTMEQLRQRSPGKVFAGGGSLASFALGGRRTPWGALPSGTGHIPGYRPVRVRRGKGGLHVVGTGSSSSTGSSHSSTKKTSSKSGSKAAVSKRKVTPLSQNTANILESVGLGDFVTAQNQLGTLDNQYSQQESLFNLFDGGGAGLPLPDLDVLMGIREQEWDILHKEFEELPHAIALLNRRVNQLQGHKAHIVGGHIPIGSHDPTVAMFKATPRRPVHSSKTQLDVAGHHVGSTGVYHTEDEIAGITKEITTLEADVKNDTRAVATIHHTVAGNVMALADQYASALSGYLNNLSAISDQKYALTQQRIGLRRQAQSITSSSSGGPAPLEAIVGAVLSGSNTVPTTSSSGSAAKRAIARKITALEGKDAQLSHAAEQIRARMRALTTAKNAAARHLRQQGFDQAWSITLKKWKTQDAITRLKAKLARLKTLLATEQSQLKQEQAALAQVTSWETGGLQGDSSIVQSLGAVGMEILDLYQQGADLPTPGRKDPTLAGIEKILSGKPPKGLGLVIPSGLIQGVQTATQAYTDFTNFQASRQALFSQFGSNFVPSGANPFAGGAGTGAGVQYYGAAAGASAGPGTLGPVMAARGGKLPGGPGSTTTTINIDNHFASGPPDPHTWSAGMAHEITAAA